MAADLIIVFAISAAIGGFALWRGSKPEILGALIVGLNIAIDLVVLFWVGEWEFSVFSGTRFAVDLLEFGLLAYLALKANRVWPIFSAAAQLVAVAGSLAVLRGGAGGMQTAYWAVTQTPVFIQLIALAIGTFFHLRRQSKLGHYRDWR